MVDASDPTESPRDLTRAHHLPKQRPDGKALHPSWLPRQRRGVTPQMIGRYPDYDVFDAQDTWDHATTAVIDTRMAIRPGDQLKFFSAEEAIVARAFCDCCVAQDTDPRIPVAELVDEKFSPGAWTATNTPTCPMTARRGEWFSPPWTRSLSPATARNRLPALTSRPRGPGRATLAGNLAKRIARATERAAGLVGVHAHDFGCLLFASLGLERDRFRWPGLPAGLHAARTNEHPRAFRVVWGDGRGSCSSNQEPTG